MQGRRRISPWREEGPAAKLEPVRAPPSAEGGVAELKCRRPRRGGPSSSAVVPRAGRRSPSRELAGRAGEGDAGRRGAPGRPRLAGDGDVAMAGGGAPAGGESLISGRPVAGARHGVLALAICFRGLSLGETSEREKLSQREKSWRGAADRERETTGRRNKNKAAWGRRGVRSTWPPAWLKTTVD